MKASDNQTIPTPIQFTGWQKPKSLLFAFSMAMLLSHCGTLPPPNAQRKLAVKTIQSSEPQSQYAGNLRNVQQRLTTQYRKWQGVRYRLGGTSMSGVDCSSFVRHVMRDGLGYELPRTTGAQASTGIAISRDNLQPGDLVFFKTGFFVRHVGIYMGDNIFLHASTSQGVILSKFNSTYWTSHYWQARRVINA